MGGLGNAIWFLCGGLWQGLSWILVGILWSVTIIGIPLAITALFNGLLLCCTIIGIPFGIQCFKIAKLAPLMNYIAVRGKGNLVLMIMSR